MFFRGDEVVTEDGDIVQIIEYDQILGEYVVRYEDGRIETYPFEELTRY